MVKRTESEHVEEVPSRGGFAELSRKILLAGIGAAALAQEEIERFVNRLVEKGELAEKDARKMIQEIMEKREKLEQERRAAAQKPTRSGHPGGHRSAQRQNCRVKQKNEELRKEHGQ